MQSWLELVFAGQAAANNGAGVGGLSLQQLAQVSSIQARAQATVGRGGPPDVAQLQALLETIRQNNTQGPAAAAGLGMAPQIEAILQNAGLLGYTGLDDRQV